MPPTLEAVRKRVETDLDDQSLQAIIDSNVQSVERSAGKADEQVEVQSALGLASISLLRRYQQIVEIEETPHQSSDPVALDASDYLEIPPYTVSRLATGANPRSGWGFRVKVTYQPEIDAALRDEITIQLVQVDVESSAFESEKEGDWQGSGDRMKLRRELLKQLREGRSGIV